MICQQLDQCVNTVQKTSLSIHSQNGKKKGRNKRTEKTSYITPCSGKQKKQKCIVFSDNRSQPSCEENGKRYSLILGNHSFDCVCVHIDKGVVDTADCCKCDYAFFLKDAEKHAIFVELKGKNVGHALEQLIATLQLEPLSGSLKGRKVYGRVSCASAVVPRIYSEEELLLQRKLIRLGGNLKICRTPFIEEYNCLDVL